ncbi:hypothetical protein [Xanthovirga aplysinae]|uniref:hypothetical protein n=1 Tax=Xanthovirga aplysinae TaxID=2529853 RepID=UPI0012BBAADC|nr:hypothetical protein [Xanthovirga aplysinae]MTI31468.1 hypothetical protein [Xanthovirga aplysinae]
MKTKSFLLLLLPLLFYFNATAQEIESEEGKNQEQEEQEEAGARFFDRVYFGGNVGLQLGTAFFVDVSPLVGYQFTERFSGGVGFTYQYIKLRENEVGWNVYGGRIFARYDIAKPFFLYGELEPINVPTSTTNGRGEVIERRWSNALFAGVGMLQPLGGRVGLSVMALYNLNYDSQTSIYPKPYVIRGGIIIMPLR